MSYIVGNISLVKMGYTINLSRTFCRPMNNNILKNPMKNAEHKPNSVELNTISSWS